MDARGQVYFAPEEEIPEEDKKRYTEALKEERIGDLSQALEELVKQQAKEKGIDIHINRSD